MSQFQLHPLLARDGVLVGRLSLCRLLLHNERRYPWLVLVPERPGLRELDELDEADAAALWQDLRRVSQVVRTLFQPDKLNVAALGNVAPQLHVHVIVRYQEDDAWPRPVWGVHPALPYEVTALEERLICLRTALGWGETECQGK